MSSVFMYLCYSSMFMLFTRSERLQEARLSDETAWQDCFHNIHKLKLQNNAYTNSPNTKLYKYMHLPNINSVLLFHNWVKL